MDTKPFSPDDILQRTEKLTLDFFGAFKVESRSRLNKLELRRLVDNLFYFLSMSSKEFAFIDQSSSTLELGNLGTTLDILAKRLTEFSAAENAELGFNFQSRSSLEALLAKLCSEFEIDTLNYGPACQALLGFLEPLARKALLLWLSGNRDKETDSPNKCLEKIVNDTQQKLSKRLEKQKIDESEKKKIERCESAERNQSQQIEPQIEKSLENRLELVNQELLKIEGFLRETEVQKIALSQKFEFQIASLENSLKQISNKISAQLNKIGIDDFKLPENFNLPIQNLQKKSSLTFFPFFKVKENARAQATGNFPKVESEARSETDNSALISVSYHICDSKDKTLSLSEENEPEGKEIKKFENSEEKREGSAKISKFRNRFSKSFADSANNIPSELPNLAKEDSEFVSLDFVCQMLNSLDLGIDFSKSDCSKDKESLESAFKKISEVFREKTEDSFKIKKELILLKQKNHNQQKILKAAVLNSKRFESQISSLTDEIDQAKLGRIKNEEELKMSMGKQNNLQAEINELKNSNNIFQQENKNLKTSVLKGMCKIKEIIKEVSQKCSAEDFKKVFELAKKIQLAKNQKLILENSLVKDQTLKISLLNGELQTQKSKNILQSKNLKRKISNISQQLENLSDNSANFFLAIKNKIQQISEGVSLGSRIWQEKMNILSSEKADLLFMNSNLIKELGILSASVKTLTSQKEKLEEETSKLDELGQKNNRLKLQLSVLKEKIELASSFKESGEQSAQEQQTSIALTGKASGPALFENIKSEYLRTIDEHDEQSEASDVHEAFSLNRGENLSAGAKEQLQAQLEPTGSKRARACQLAKNYSLVFCGKNEGLQIDKELPESSPVAKSKDEAVFADPRSSSKKNLFSMQSVLKSIVGQKKGSFCEEPEGKAINEFKASDQEIDQNANANRVSRPTTAFEEQQNSSNNNENRSPNRRTNKAEETQNELNDLRQQRKGPLFISSGSNRIVRLTETSSSPFTNKSGLNYLALKKMVSEQLSKIQGVNNLSEDKISALSRRFELLNQKINEFKAKIEAYAQTNKIKITAENDTNSDNLDAQNNIFQAKIKSEFVKAKTSNKRGLEINSAGIIVWQANKSDNKTFSDKSQGKKGQLHIEEFGPEFENADQFPQTNIYNQSKTKFISHKSKPSEPLSTHGQIISEKKDNNSNQKRITKQYLPSNKELTAENKDSFLISKGREKLISQLKAFLESLCSLLHDLSNENKEVLCNFEDNEELQNFGQAFDLQISQLRNYIGQYRDELFESHQSILYPRTNKEDKRADSSNSGKSHSTEKRKPVSFENKKRLAAQNLEKSEPNFAIPLRSEGEEAEAEPKQRSSSKIHERSEPGTKPSAFLLELAEFKEKQSVLKEGFNDLIGNITCLIGDNFDLLSQTESLAKRVDERNAKRGPKGTPGNQQSLKNELLGVISKCGQNNSSLREMSDFLAANLMKFIEEIDAFAENFVYAIPKNAQVSELIQENDFLYHKLNEANKQIEHLFAHKQMAGQGRPPFARFFAENSPRAFSEPANSLNSDIEDSQELPRVPLQQRMQEFLQRLLNPSDFVLGGQGQAFPLSENEDQPAKASLSENAKEVENEAEPSESHRIEILENYNIFLLNILRQVKLLIDDQETPVKARLEQLQEISRDLEAMCAKKGDPAGRAQRGAEPAARPRDPGAAAEAGAGAGAAGAARPLQDRALGPELPARLLRDGLLPAHGQKQPVAERGGLRLARGSHPQGKRGGLRR